MKQIQLGKQTLDFIQPIVMGILNVTPDSFFDGGKYNNETALIDRIHQIVSEGAGIIDLGAYSTRPGAAYVSCEEELIRLDPAIELIRRLYPEMPVSVDTFRSDVARSLNSCYGAIIVNDISGGMMDNKMFDFVAESGLPYILMHIQGTPQTMQKNPTYKNIIREIMNFLTVRIERLKALNFTNIIIDPGFGFGKTMEHNYELMQHLNEFNRFEFPLLVGISRKTMIWKLLEISPQEALNGTIVLNTYSLLQGASILRVHDVKAAVDTVKIIKQIKM